MQPGKSKLDSPIEYLKGVGPAKAELLNLELNIFRFEDLLLHFPFRYIDRSKIYTVQEITHDLPIVQLKGVIQKVKLLGDGRAKRLVAQFADHTGTIELIWFQKVKQLQEIIRPGLSLLIFGKPTTYNNSWNIVHPDMELLTGNATSKIAGGLQAVYSTTEKLKKKALDSKGIWILQQNLQDNIQGNIKENLPADLIRRFDLLPRDMAFRFIHFPPNLEMLEKAQFRLKFEELFFIQLRLLKTKTTREVEIQGHIFDKVGTNFHNFYHHHLPFELTNAQKRVIKEIRADMKSGKQMNRLLQGDVGSGKTMVALMSMLIGLDNNMQACLMAPTEILATQHYNNISVLLSEMGIQVALLTGSTSTAGRKDILQRLSSGELQILIGTHALLEDRVQFHDLGLVIVDEQHRFGVAQRAKMWGKNQIPPHVLVMTATPIPRTLSMTLYGDLDTSVIDELPPGRKPIDTRHVFEKDRMRVFGFIREQIAQGRQVYIVYPLIEESETLDLNNLSEGYESIVRSFPPPDYSVGMVHGKMKAADKELEMQLFKKGQTKILVSTTVIEVGVDVPNATIMVIENAERFGLSQLHQLRGRVGRGGNKSFCILLTGYKLSSDARVRMETMVRTNNGFEIAEVDLQIRGPGDIAGTRQSGMIELKIADLAKDYKLLKLARHSALSIVETDPLMELPEHQMMKLYLEKQDLHDQNWSLIS